jgi:hypothetical protein
MNIESLRELHETRPFRPFAIHAADGRTFPIPRNEFLAYDPEGALAVALRTNSAFSILDLELITELAALPVNGKKKRTGK